MNGILRLPLEVPEREHLLGPGPGRHEALVDRDMSRGAPDPGFDLDLEPLHHR